MEAWGAPGLPLALLIKNILTVAICATVIFASEKTM
jgi:hypothetical protein